MCGSLNENAKSTSKNRNKEVKKVINLSQTIWSPQGETNTRRDMGQHKTTHNIESDKTTQWHEKERERGQNYYEQD